MELEILEYTLNELKNKNIDTEQAKNIINYHMDKETAEELTLLLDTVKKYNFDESSIESPYNIVIAGAEKRTIKELIKLIEKYAESKFNYTVYKAATDEGILEKRTVDDQLQMMDMILKRKGDGLQETIYHLEQKPNLLEKRTGKEHMQLIDRYIKDRSYATYWLITNKEVIKARTGEEHLKLVDKLIEHKCTTSMSIIAENYYVLKLRNLDEQLQLMDRVAQETKRQFEENVREVAINQNVLERRNIKEQLQLMDAVRGISPYNDSLVELATNLGGLSFGGGYSGILDKRTCEEQLKLIAKVKESFPYEYYAIEIAKNSGVLRYRNIEQQLQLMDQVIEIAKNRKDFDKKIHRNMEKIYNVITNTYVLICKKQKDQLRLINKIKESNYNQEVSDMAINEYVIKNKSIEEQLEMMDILMDGQTTPYIENMKNTKPTVTNLDRVIHFMDRVEKNIFPEEYHGGINIKGASYYPVKSKRRKYVFGKDY